MINIKENTATLQATLDDNTQMLTAVKEQSTVVANLVAPTISSNNTNSYLAEMEFATSFNKLVDDIAKIAEKYLTETVSNNPQQKPENVSGFTQFNNQQYVW